MKKIATLCCLLAFAATPALAADGPHVQQRIVPGQAIGKVAIGQTLPQVKKVLGPPESTIEKRQVGFGKTFVEYSWNLTEWRVAFVAGRVTRIGSSVRTERTKEGVGVGTEGHKVEKTYGIVCVTGQPDRGHALGYWCAARSRGGARTVFNVNDVCTKPRFYGNCPDGARRRQVTGVWVVAAGADLPVTLYPQYPMP